MPGAFITADLAGVFNSKEFAETPGSVTVAGVPVTHAIFDEDDVEVTQGDGEAVIMAQPSITCPKSEVSTATYGQTVVVRGVAYTVINSFDHGDETVTIYLKVQ